MHASKSRRTIDRRSAVISALHRIKITTHQSRISKPKVTEHSNRYKLENRFVGPLRLDGFFRYEIVHGGGAVSGVAMV